MPNWCFLALIRYEVFVNGNDDLAGGHLGLYKTYKKLRKRFYWRGQYVQRR